MSMPKNLTWALTALALTACSGMPSGSVDTAGGGSGFGLGRAATPAEIKGWDLDGKPDGSGLPPGQGSVAAGKQVYEKQCASCHGATGTGGTAAALVGGIGSLSAARPVQTVGSFWPYATTLFDYTRRAMPWDKPNSLSADEVYAVTAYVLNMNKIVPADAVMNAQTLPAVRMPNRDGFIHADNAPKPVAPRCMSNC